jgi:hypothetical protein
MQSDQFLDATRTARQDILETFRPTIAMLAFSATLLRFLGAMIEGTSLSARAHEHSRVILRLDYLFTRGTRKHNLSVSLRD